MSAGTKVTANLTISLVTRSVTLLVTTLPVNPIKRY